MTAKRIGVAVLALGGLVAGFVLAKRFVEALAEDPGLGLFAVVLLTALVVVGGTLSDVFEQRRQEQGSNDDSR